MTKIVKIEITETIHTAMGSNEQTTVEWVECPDHYDADEITNDDLTNDSQISVVDIDDHEGRMMTIDIRCARHNAEDHGIDEAKLQLGVEARLEEYYPHAAINWTWESDGEDHRTSGYALTDHNGEMTESILGFDAKLLLMDRSDQALLDVIEIEGAS